MLLEGQSPDPLERVAVSKKHRWPSGLSELAPFYYRVKDSKCAISDRLIRSVLYMNRLCNGNGVVDISTITQVSEVSEEFRSEFKEHLTKHGKAIRRGKMELNSIPSTRVTSSGPNSKPKWQTADLEAYVLIHSEYAEHFKNLCEVTGNSDLYEYVYTRASLQTRVERKRLRYITGIRDKGNKCRAIAISAIGPKFS
jgi:hypothetical protein